MIFKNNRLIGSVVTSPNYSNDENLVYSAQASGDNKVNDSYNVFYSNIFENGYIALHLTGKGWKKTNENSAHNTKDV